MSTAVVSFLYCDCISACGRLRRAVGRDAHLISLSHVAVEDPSHALDGRVLQLVGAAHVVVDAPVAPRERR